VTLEPDIERVALRLLASREHSRRELERKLVACGYAAREVERLVEDLAERDLVSDRRMVETYVAERVRKGFGPVRIRQELRHRGLPDELIESYLERSPREWVAALSQAHNKRFGPGRACDDKERTKRARFLEYRGFPAELIADFLDGRDEF